MDNNLNRIRDDALNKGIEIGEEQFLKIGYISKEASRAIQAGVDGKALIIQRKNQFYSEALYIKVNHAKETTGISK